MAGSLRPGGRPSLDSQRQRYRLQQLIADATTDDELLEIWEHAKEMAVTTSDIQWTALCLSYLLGKPAPMTEAVAGVQFNGDLNIQLNQLSPDQLRALTTLDASYTTVPAESENPDALER